MTQAVPHYAARKNSIFALLS